MDEECTAKVMISSVEENRCRGRPTKVGMDGCCKAGFKGEGYVSGTR